MKNKELAELLGIPAKYTHDQFVKPMFYDFDYTQRYHVNHYDWYAVYPDFTEPENFVKLLELLVNNGINVMFDFKHHKNDKNLVELNKGDATGENLTEAIIDHIETSVEYYEFDGVEEGINNLKQAAQQVDWRY